jgi:hypothetical protein
MDRIKIIKYLLKQKKSKNYLEIGVFNGHVFFKVKSKFKIAVDPEFQFDFLRKFGKTLLNPYNLFNKYFLKTSDLFFSEVAPNLLLNKKIDIALVDGMHEYHYALRDVENTLNYLDNDGIIIMHDCNPLTEEASITFSEWEAKGMTGTWNGDLWKTIVHLRSVRKDINVFVLNCDHGLGIIAKRKPENTLNFSADEINALTYQEFNANRNEWLNLKNADYIFEYLKTQKIV